MADTWHGPYTVLGDPHPTDPSHTSFHSQISSVFQVVGKKDLYIAVADRWCPQDMDVPYDFTREMFEYLFQGRREEIPACPGGEIRHPAPCRGQGAGHLHRGLRLAALPL